MKPQLAIAAIACGCIAAGAAQADIPVLDGANLVQAINQIAAWKKQYDQMQQQYTALTGSRGLGNIQNNPALQTIVSQDAANVYGAIQSRGSAGLSSTALFLRSSTKIYDCEDRQGTDQTSCQA